MKDISSWKFGNTKKEANNLVNLVISGKKKATSSLFESYYGKNKPLPKTGSKSIIIDSKDKPRCLIVTTRVTIKPFGKITSQFASREGEGDCSLSYWRKTHSQFFTKRLKQIKKKFDQQVLVVCEEFKVLKIIDDNELS